LNGIIAFFSEVLFGKYWNLPNQKSQTALQKFPKSSGMAPIIKLDSSGLKEELLLFIQKNL
jgi:hypothetical protein